MLVYVRVCVWICEFIWEEKRFIVFIRFLKGVLILKMFGIIDLMVFF